MLLERIFIGWQQFQHARAPLFTCPSQAGPVVFTYSMFISRLKTCLGRAGVDPYNYAGHSLRRGGASFALACNVPGDLIKLQGDWKSDCYQRYLDPDIQTNFFVAKAMSDKVQSLRVFLTGIILMYYYYYFVHYLYLVWAFG